MENMSKTAAILLLSKNPDVIELTYQVIAQHEHIDLFNQPMDPSSIHQVFTAIQPVMILVDFDSQHQPYYLVNQIATLYPSCPIIAVLPASKIDKSERAIQSGASSFINFPDLSESLENILMKMVDTQDHIQDQSQDYNQDYNQDQSQDYNQDQSQDYNQSSSSQSPTADSKITSNRTITVFSPKGGVGTTTIATNLAIALHKNTKEDVLLVDGKLMFGHVALYLNLRTGNSISDLLSHIGMLDQRLVSQVAVRHTSGIHVLPCPIAVSDVQEIQPEALYEILRSLQQIYPNIIIDGGNYLNENTVTFMDASQKIILVLNPDLASIRDARQFLEITETLSYPKEKTSLLINLKGSKADIKTEEIETILKTKISGKIPADEMIVQSCLNDGTPILLKKPRHPISKAITDFSKDLIKLIQTVKETEA